MRNLEIKVRLDRLNGARRLADALGARDEGEVRQVDTYFRVLRGRLKLREVEGQSGGTLIHYDRPDQTISRYSTYQLSPVADPAGMKVLLSAAVGTLVTVEKTRQLFVYGATRIHLDEVRGLGCFVELETVVGRQSEEEARAEHDLVKRGMRLHEREIVPVSYSDLLLLSDDG